MAEPSPHPRPVVIVGAGLAGLTCAKVLDESGLTVRVLDAADEVGGRVRTDVHPEGFLLDRGFQVFLDSYPEATRHLDYGRLDLKPFEPGAFTRMASTELLHSLVDPFRRPHRAVGVALSPATTVKDKLLIARLRLGLARKDVESLLQEGEPMSTLQFLRDYGFSERILGTFFRPFFGGVFLDRSLSTSAKLFRWLFRLFANGNACLPAAGMQAIPRQLADSLPADSLKLGTTVRSVGNTSVTCTEGVEHEAAAVVVAVEAPAAKSLLGDTLPADFNDRTFRRTSTLYFAGTRELLPEPMLVLSGTDPHLQSINTIAPLSLAAPSYAPKGQSLLSANVVPDDDTPTGEDLLEAVRKALAHFFGDDAAAELRHLATYDIEHALPSQPAPVMAEPHKKSRLSSGVYLAGDHRDTASINGAMLSGRRAAEAVLASGVGR
ncbi:MAG: NAD(P)/FAD-dependent oxidoreductase [Planctomycetota bacterium]